VAQARKKADAAREAAFDGRDQKAKSDKARIADGPDRPEIPLRTNGSENDVRCQVTKRKISSGTRSDTGRDCRDAFLGLSKTCAKLGISFWEYLGSRLAVPNHTEIRTCRQLSGIAAPPPDCPDFCPSYAFQCEFPHKVRKVFWAPRTMPAFGDSALAERTSAVLVPRWVPDRDRF
jgi:hypothetical protein